MIRPTADRVLFLVAAAFNWLIAGSFLLAGDRVLAWLHIYPPQDVVLYRLLLVNVALFGAGYFWVGLDVTRNHAVVGLGLIGKLAMFVVFWQHALAGGLSYRGVWVAAIDVVFAALFAEFLWRAGRSAEGRGVGGACQSRPGNPQ